VLGLAMHLRLLTVSLVGTNYCVSSVNRPTIHSDSLADIFAHLIVDVNLAATAAEPRVMGLARHKINRPRELELILACVQS
jgi:hypothetical protein